jgi:hypothetical protein
MRLRTTYDIVLNPDATYSLTAAGAGFFIAQDSLEKIRIYGTLKKNIKIAPFCHS